MIALTTSKMIKRSVTRLPREPGPAGWHEILGTAPSYPKAEGDLTADWLIIGGGFAGLSAAQRLCELRGGDDIILLEASQIGAGPAGRNSGFMIDLPHELGDDGYAGAVDGDLKQIALNRHAQAFATANAQAYDMPEEAVRLTGRVNGAVNDSGKAHNDDYATHLDRLGEAYRHLTAADMKEMTGSDFYQSGLFMPGCVMLQPALYIRELAHGLVHKQTHPVSLYEQSPAISFEQQADSWLVTTPHASIKAKTIIMAVNGHAESFGFYKNRLMHVFTYASMTEALTNAQQNRLGGELSWGITPADPMGSTIRRHDGAQGNYLVVRNRGALTLQWKSQTRALRLLDVTMTDPLPVVSPCLMMSRWPIGGLGIYAYHAILCLPLARLNANGILLVVRMALAQLKAHWQASALWI